MGVCRRISFVLPACSTKVSGGMVVETDTPEVRRSRKAALELKEDQSGLKCVECKRVYPIRDDIPVMLIDEATIEP